MEKNELISKVNEVLADEFEVEVSDITPEANIKETLQLDSLSIVDMIALIESNFGVKIQGSEVASIKTFADLYDYLAARA
ncbi:MAG: acyl carrier protein [Bacteroidales bacterium]|nr:acyl carrier protein [Bacteroidales bacterium]MDD7724286.1 acyl carrier protein [Bacteroidales bacterium]MDY4175525.1 acyl carrier protein [Bacteroidales bacterium]